MKRSIDNKFLINSSETGRFIVISKRTGRKYYVEPIGDPHIIWGSVKPGSDKLTFKKGWKKFKGSVDECDSLVTRTNFNKVHEIGIGQSPLSYIDDLDSKY